MRLERIILDDYRGVRHAEIALGDGVTVIVGPNEAGKSSIAEAIVLLRRYKASSKAREVLAVQPVGRDVGPQVTVELRTGPYALTFRKRWIVRPQTVLVVREPAPEQLSGDQAHDRFLAILDETVDTALLEALEVGQGESLDQPRLATLQALQAALADADRSAAADACADSGDAAAGPKVAGPDEASAGVPAGASAVAGPDGFAGFEAHDGLMARIRAEYERWFTPKGRFKRTVTETDDAVERLEAEAVGLRERSVRMDELVEQHGQQEQGVARLTEQAARARADVARLEEATLGLHRLREAVETAERDRREAAAALDAAEERQRSRTETIAEITRRRDAMGETDERARTLAEAARAGQGRVDGARQALALTEQRLEQARDAARAAARALARARDREELSRLIAALDRAEQADARRTEAQAVLETVTVTERTVRRLRELDTERRVAAGTRDASAAQIDVHRVGDVAVSVDGVAVGADASVETPVREPVHVVADGVVEIEVRPAATSQELEQAAQKAERAFQRALERAGVASLEEAQRLADRRAEAEQTRERAAGDLAAAVQGVAGDAGDAADATGAEDATDATDATDASDGAEVAAEGGKTGGDAEGAAADELGVGLERLRRRAAGLRARLETTGDATVVMAGDQPPHDGASIEGSDDVAANAEVAATDAAGAGAVAATDVPGAGTGTEPSRDELQRLADAAEIEAQEAEREEKRARRAHERLRTAQEERQTEVIRAEEAARAAREELARLEQRLETERATTSDPALEGAAASAAERVAEVDAALAQARQALADANGDQLELELDNARQLIDDRARDLEQAKDHLGALKGEISAYAGEGIYDRLEQAEAELEAAIDVRDRTHRAAEAARLLHDTFVRHRDEAQARYAAPYRERIERLSRMVFGQQVQVEVTADLEIATRTLDGQTVPFASLSGGAREQLALLGRLACAQLVAGDGGAPLILDDALGFADPDRLHALNLVLSRVGREAQIVVLTCQPDRFDEIGGATTVPLLKG